MVHIKKIFKKIEMKRKTQTARKYLQVTSDKRCVSIIYKKHSKTEYENRSPTDISPKKRHTDDK